ncbi:DUF3099 domain-containing protein [Cryobacterium sp. AP23]
MKQQSITTLPLSPEEERRRRMIRYAVTMGIRMVCIVLMLFVHGWWLLVCALGAILLPYFAVVAANVHGAQPTPTVLRPGAVVPLPRRDPAPGDTGQARTDQARTGQARTDQARTDRPQPDGDSL